MLSYHVASMQSLGLVPNYESSIAKLFNTEMQFRLAKAGIEIMGLYGQLEPQSKHAQLRGKFEQKPVGHAAHAACSVVSECLLRVLFPYFPAGQEPEQALISFDCASRMPNVPLGHFPEQWVWPLRLSNVPATLYDGL